MVRHVLALVSMAVLVGCASRGAPPTSDTVPTSPPPESAPVPLPDSSIGLAPGTAFEQPAQHAVPENQASPGDSTPRERPFATFPPVVPHTLEGIDTITLDENACLECHAVAVAADLGAPAVPASHRTDLRRAPEVVGQEVAGARWVCTSCHAVWRDVAPLVPSR